MALEEMLQALEGEAVSRSERIRRRAEDEARALLSAAGERRRPLQQAAMARAQTTLVAERARRLTRARFAVRREVILAKEALMDEVFKAARAQLVEVRQRPSYPVIFRVLAQEALEGVTGRVRLLVGTQDAALAEDLLKGLGLDGEIEPGLDTAGGLVVEVDAGRVVIDNTLEARLAKAERFLRPQVNKCLFG